MSHKRSLDAVAPPEQEAARSPRKRLRRTVQSVLVMMWLDRRRRARAVTLEQMVRQAQLDMAKLFFFLMVIVARLSSVERLLLDLPNLLQRLLAQQIATFQRTVTDSIEDTIRSVFWTERQERQAASLPNGVFEPSRQMPEHLPETGSSSGVIKLRFVDADRPKDPLYTGSPVQWKNGQNAKVAIFRDGKQIKGGDLSKLQIEILPVHADFFTERGLEDFTKQELSKQIYTYNGKESALTTVNLKNGEANIGSIIFTESSYRKKLRLTARVKRQDLAVRVQEAISEPFIVKVGRSKANEKSYPPMKEEPVHCLETISPKGKHCRYLADNNITTVKHLMRHYHIDKSGLQKLTDMKKDDWSTLIKHATTSDPGFETYSYRVVEENTELLFNDFYDIVGMMINGFYVPVNDFDHFQQLKANNWKMSAYRSFDERENSGGLTPDYFMSNGRPVREEPLNNDAEFGEQHPFRQQNGFAPAEVLSNNDTGPSQHTAHQDLGQHGPSMPYNGTPYCHLAQGNILHCHGSLSAQPTIPSYPLVQEHDLITGTCVTAQHNLYFNPSTTDARGTSFPAADGVGPGTSSLNHAQADDLSWIPQLEKWLESEAHVANQGIVPANNAELPNSNNQLDDYEHDGGNR